ncbi:Uncharacterized protein GBIM_02694 [Gryllus bimaculatus]|nr:Uncharacterized protein GBIM_02694 [Gryllus bimaculatus]
MAPLVVKEEEKEAPLRAISLGEELKRNPDMKETDLALLRDWADKQPHLPKVLDRELVLFLHSCYYRVEAAKVTADTYFTARTHLPEFFAHRDATKPEVQLAAKVVGFVTLSKPTPEGHKVIVARFVDPDPSNFVHVDATKVFLMVTDLWLLSEGSAPGHVIVFDMTNVTFGHVTRLGPLVFKKFFYYLQDALPFRLKGLHFINVVPLLDKIMAIIRPFLKKEILDVLHIHAEGMESFYKFVPKENLTEDYGGAAPSFISIHNRELALFLHSCYYSVEAAKVTADTYFTARTHLPEFFSNRDATRPDVAQAAKIACMSKLPKKTPEGYTVIFCRMVDQDPSHFVHHDVVKVFFMLMDLLLLEEGTAPGHIIIMDMDGINLGHVARLSIITYKKFFYFLQEGLPFRLKGLHFMNVVPFMDKIMAMMRPFMNKEIQDMLRLYKVDNVEQLYKYVPKDILPENYGGTAPSYMTLADAAAPAGERPLLRRRGATPGGGVEEAGARAQRWRPLRRRRLIQEARHRLNPRNISSLPPILLSYDEKPYRRSREDLK